MTPEVLENTSVRLVWMVVRSLTNQVTRRLGASAQRRSCTSQSTCSLKNTQRLCEPHKVNIPLNARFAILLPSKRSSRCYTRKVLSNNPLSLHTAPSASAEAPLDRFGKSLGDAEQLGNVHHHGLRQEQYVSDDNRTWHDPIPSSLFYAGKVWGLT